MKLTPRIQKAIDFASRLHCGQLKKGEGNLPYISHPFSVAWILASYTDDEDVIVAALLHDVLEDVEGYSYDDMVRDFGEKVAMIVKGVSEDKEPNSKEEKKATWKVRKLNYIEALKHDSFESLMVSAADKIHNLKSIIAAYKSVGESLWENFNAPKENQMWFYNQVLDVLKVRLNNSIVLEYELICCQAELCLK